MYTSNEMTDAPHSAGINQRDDALTSDEREVINLFATHIRRNQSCVMPIHDIVQSAGAGGGEAMRAAIRQLAARGWLVANAAMHWEDHHECVLIGEALRMAQAIATERRE